MAKAAQPSTPKTPKARAAGKSKATPTAPSSRADEGYASSFQKILDALVSRLEKRPDGIPHAEIDHVIKKALSMWNFVPRVAVFGQAGSGKSTLCNALFGKHICEVSAVKACTRKAQEVPVQFGKNQMTVIDMPGVGESRSTDAQYTALYQESLKDTDLVLWLLKADSRAFASDLHVWELVGKTIQDAGMPFLFILTQADKIEPSLEWDSAASEPSPAQMGNLVLKRDDVSKQFNIPKESIAFCSPARNYQLKDLVIAMLRLLPNEKKSAMLRHTEIEVQSQEAQQVATTGFWQGLWNATKNAAKRAWDWIFANPETVVEIGKVFWDAVRKKPSGPIRRPPKRRKM